MKNKRKGKIGSSFDDFLKEEGMYEEVEATAIKRVLAWQIQKEMTAQGITKAGMARRMKTSRSQLDRLLDPDNDKVLLQTIPKAASAVGKRGRSADANQKGEGDILVSADQGDSWERLPLDLPADRVLFIASDS